MKRITLFLSGSVRKGAGDNRSPEFFWSDEQIEVLRSGFGDVEAEILDPNEVEIPKYLAQDRFQADIEMLLRSQAVLVDARTKKGLGVGAEMVLARQAKIPVLTLCPMGSAYRGMMVDETGNEREWIHPFVAELSDQIFDDVADIVKWLQNNVVATQ